MAKVAAKSCQMCRPMPCDREIAPTHAAMQIRPSASWTKSETAGPGLRWPKVAIDEVCTKSRVQEATIRYLGFVLSKGSCFCKMPSPERLARIINLNYLPQRGVF